MQAGIIIAALLVTGITSVALVSENNHEVKRQVDSFEVMFGPNNEICIIDGDTVVVYIRGYNARMYDVMDGEMVQTKFPQMPQVVIGDDRITIDNIFQYQSENHVPGPINTGPGTVYVSDGPDGVGRAFFTDWVDRYEQIIMDAPAPRVTVDVERVMDGGDTVVQTVVNEGEFSKIVTNQPTKDIRAFETVSYSSGTIMAQQQSYSGIDEFSVIRRGSDGNVRNTIYNSSQQVIVQGPGQVFVGGSSAFFIEKGSSDIAERVNSQIVGSTFNFNQVSPSVVMVTDINSNSIILLSQRTKKIRLPDAMNVTYSMSEMLATFVDKSGRVTHVPVLAQLSVYDNNGVERFPPDVSTVLSTGGTLIIDPLENTALFITDANPEAKVVVWKNNPPFEERRYYSFETDSYGVRFLVCTVGSPPVTQTIKHITGSFVTKVDSSETVIYVDSKVVIEDFNGNTKTRIGQVNKFIAYAGRECSGKFNMSAPAPFRGPGTLSYSRGTAFYTTDEQLGRDLISESPPIPGIYYDVVPMMPNEIEGYNYTVATVIQTIGHDEVITYEATSYTTTSSQEIIYSDDQVTVSMPRRAGSGMVVFMGGAQTVSYTDMNGNMQVITGVNTFHEFSGGDVTTTTSPDDRTVQGPGKVYVSEDGTEVMFSNSNIITPEVAEIIRRGEIPFSVPADQFSSIYTRVYNFSTDSALVTLPGGGVIWSSTFNGSRDSFYIDNDRVQSAIRQAVGSILFLTKSPPSKDVGIIRTIFNGREIYTYSPLGGSRDIRIGSSESFFFNGTALIGDSLPGGPYGGINMVVNFDGIEVKTINSSMQFDGFGLLLVPSDNNTAFYTTSPSAINYLLQSIANVENFLVSPQVEPGKGRITSKDGEVAVDMGKDVTVYDGANVTFVCNVRSARPEPEVTFFRILPDDGAIPLNDSDRVSIDDNNLTIATDTTDSGKYACRADNGVPPVGMAMSTLTVLPAEPPVLQPGWFPFELQSGQKIIFPADPAVMETIDLREFKELIFACRVDGKPKARVMWRFNDMEIRDSSLPRNGYEIINRIGGRSVLVFDLLNVFNLTNVNGLLGTNTIQCTADNEAGMSVTGTAMITGEIITCPNRSLTDDTVCSTTCGYGLREYTHVCMRFTDEGVSEDIDIDDVPIRVVPLLMRNRVCTAREGVELVICPIIEFRWNASEWTDCSRTCGGGFQTRNITCLSETYSVNSLYNVVVDSVVVNVTEDLMCDMFEEAGERPADRQLCELQDCPFWQASQFGECSVTCGGGVRMREVNCVINNGTFIDMNNKTQTSIIVVDDSLCNQDEKPSNMTDCNNYPCVFRWSTGQFGPCGETSLTGPVVDEFPYCRERGVVCLNEDNDVVNDTSCDSRIRPSPLASCGGGRCFAGFWNALKYGDCSATCGYGMRTRELQCYSPDTWTLVPGDFCDISKKPYTEQQCFLQNCRGMCLRDESSLCPILASAMMCGMPYAMGNNGYRCCISCMGMGGGD